MTASGIVAIEAASASRRCHHGRRLPRTDQPQQTQPAVEPLDVDDVDEPVGAPDVAPDEDVEELDVFCATVPDVPEPCCWVLPVLVESSSPQPAAVRPTPSTTMV